MHDSWKPILQTEFDQPYFKELAKFLHSAYETKTVFPPKQQVFSAFTTDLNNVKVVIIGQDPYHGPGQAHGLAFSVRDGVQQPPSLQNIFKEIQNEYGYPIPDSGCLESWARQGVFLLNTVLTVREGEANSHSDCGWQTITDNVIQILNNQKQPIVFLLWGKQAEKKKELINNPNHLVLITSHPSPFSARRGFLGSNHFIKANEFLSNNGLEEINWEII